MHGAQRHASGQTAPLAIAPVVRAGDWLKTFNERAFDTNVTCKEVPLQMPPHKKHE